MRISENDAPPLLSICDATADMGKTFLAFGGEGEKIDRTKYLSASETTTCIRRLWFEKNEPEIKAAAEADKNWGYAARGDAFEEWAVAQLDRWSMAHGVEPPIFTSHKQRTFISKDGLLSGTPDGLWQFDDLWWLLEFKSVDPRANLESMRAPKPAHKAQVIQNIGLLREHGFNVDAGVVFYADASNYGRQKQFVVEYDEAAYRAAKLKAQQLFSADKAEGMPAHGLLVGNDSCAWCSYTEQCSAIQVAAGKDAVAARKAPAVAFPKAIPKRAGDASAVHEYARLKEAADRADEKVKDAAAALKALLGETDDHQIETDNYVAKLTTVSGRKSLDVKAYAEATGVAPEPYYKTGKPSERLDLKKKD